MKLIPLALAAACALATVPAAAQDLVQQQLQASIEVMANEGFSQRGEFRTGALRNGAEETIRVQLEAGVSYAIVGVCDGDCSDLDLFLNDPAGRPLSQDIAEDDVPVVTAEITRAGSYQLRITMPACSVDPCGYGIGVFARN